MAATYEQICEFLNHREVLFTRHDDGAIFVTFQSNKYPNPDAEASLFLVVLLEDEGRFIRLFMPRAFIYHDGPYKAVVLQAALFVNYQTKMLQFEYDPRDGEIRAVVEFPIEDSLLTESQFFRAFYGLCSLVEEYSAFIHHAMNGTLDAQTSGLDKEVFAQFMRLMRTQAGNDTQLLEDSEMLQHKAAKAAEMYERLNRKYLFQPGQLVRWKPEMRNRKYPAYGECGVVVSLLDHPVFDEGGHSGSSSFREPLDVVLGFVDSDGDFITYHFDSRRFAPVLPGKALS